MQRPGRHHRGLVDDIVEDVAEDRRPEALPGSELELHRALHGLRGREVAGRGVAGEVGLVDAGRAADHQHQPAGVVHAGRDAGGLDRLEFRPGRRHKRSTDRAAALCPASASPAAAGGSSPGVLRRRRLPPVCSHR